MTKSEIDAFIAASQYGSLSEAATQIFVTQPALTRRIQNLERELGYDLFMRGKGKRGITLTPQGQAFLPVARRWNNVYRDAYALQGMDSRPAFRISSIGSVSRFLLPEIFREFTQDNVPYHLNFHLCHSTEGYTLIENGFSDVVLMDYVRPRSTDSRTVVSIPVYSVPFVLLGGDAWKDVKTVSVDSLDPSRELSLPWNLAFDSWHEKVFGMARRPFAFFDDVSVIPDIVRDDLFVFVPLSEGLRLTALSKHLHMIDLKDGPPDEVIHCLMSVRMQEHPVILQFLDAIARRCEASQGIHCLLPQAAE